MAKRRGNGEGSIYKRKDGSWMASISAGIDPATGKTKRKTFYGKTRKEAAEKMNKTLHEIKTGSYIELATVTLEQWLTDWLNGRKPHIAESSWNAYDTMIRVHIIPALGKVKLKDLKTRDIQNLLNDKFENGRSDGKGGLSPRSVKYIYQTLNSALRQAVRERLLSYNVTEAAELPKQEAKEMTTLSTEDLTKFLEAAKESPQYTAFLLEFYTGLRRGELLGLRWKDIDFKKGTLTVRQQLVKGKKIKDTKTSKSKRTITLYKDALEALKTHKKKQNEIKLMLGPNYQDNDLVFCTQEGKPLDPDNFTKQFQRLLKKAGIPKTRFHDTRHTFATLSLEAGVPLKTVQEILGHSTISITGDIYSHVTPKMHEEAANKMGGVLAGCMKE